jgi:hypothetical protein
MQFRCVFIEKVASVRPVNAEFGFLGAAVGDGEVEAIQAGSEVAGAGAGSGRRLREAGVCVGGGLPLRCVVELQQDCAFGNRG